MYLRFEAIYAVASKPENMLPFSPETDRIVLFSDHHKGAGSIADDFKKNAALYDRALSHYEDRNFRVILLGDNEELWETRIDRILGRYRAIIAKEIRLSPEGLSGKKIRLWGNHDKEVILRRFDGVLRQTGEDLFQQVDFREGLCLGPDIFLVHGHQGRFLEDQAWRISRWAIKIVWKTIQKLFLIGRDGPAENIRIRESLERSYYSWARKKKVLLICGHTHMAVFGSQTHYDRIRAEVLALRKNGKMKPTGELRRLLEEKETELQIILKKNHGRPPKSIGSGPGEPVPCYFNDGCCGYTNGITCIELDRGWIRLIKWDRESSARQVLTEELLHKIIENVKRGQARSGISANG